MASIAFRITATSSRHVVLALRGRRAEPADPRWQCPRGKQAQMAYFWHRALPLARLARRNAWWPDRTSRHVIGCRVGLVRAPRPADRAAHDQPIHRVPSQTEGEGMSEDTRALRSALGRFATGVCLVTVRDGQGSALAMTVNSFASVSLEPPLVLWSLQRDSLNFEHFAYPTHYAINVLGREHEDLSTRYATPGRHRMDAAHFSAGHNDAPMVEGALARFECTLHNTFDGGDHLIIVGRVTRYSEAPAAGEPLLFYRGQYRALSGDGSG